MATLTSIVGQEVNEKYRQKSILARKLMRSTKAIRVDRREEIELGILLHGCGWPDFAWGTTKILVTQLSSSKR